MAVQPAIEVDPVVGNTLLGNPACSVAKSDQFGAETKIKTVRHQSEPNGQAGFRERNLGQTPAGVVTAIMATAPKTMNGPNGTSALRLRWAIMPITAPLKRAIRIAVIVI